MRPYPFPTLRPWLLPLYHVPFLCKGMLSVRKRWQQLRRRKFVVKRFGKVFLLLDTQDLACRYLDTWSCYEHLQMRRLYDLARELDDPVFLDVGAYFGVYTFFFAATGRFREQHAVEPTPHNYEHLRANWFLNGCSPHIHLHGIAASDESRELEIRTPLLRNRGDSSIEWGEPGAGSTARVPGVPLDSLLSFRGRNLVIKVDVQGHEVRALRGMANLLANNHCVLQIEALEDQWEAVRRQMEAFGYAWRGRISIDYYYTPA